MLDSDLIAKLYEAAVDPDAETLLAQVTADLVGVDGGVVWTAEGERFELFLADIIQDTQQDYSEYYHKLDPWSQPDNFTRFAPGRAMLGYELFDERELVSTEFYNDFCRPQGVFRPMTTWMVLAPGAMAKVGVQQQGTNNLLGPEDKPKLEGLVPHLTRALQLRRRLAAAERKSETGYAALDALAFGAMVCNAEGACVFVNEMAEMLARSGTGLSLGGHGKPVTAAMSKEGTQLRRLIRDAAMGGAGGTMQLSNGEGAVSLLLLVSHLPNRFREGEGRGLALVALRSVQDAPAFSEALLAAMFNLSPAQAALAWKLSAGSSLEEAAMERGVKITTARSQLSDIFNKTGAENQRDLLRIIGQIPPVRFR